jgi:drug/metabolite transporter (DMT)-like permease
MTLTASFASFFLKKSTGGGTILSIIKNKYLYAGGFLYVIAALFNIWLLQKLPYSVVVPLGSICYIWTMFIAGIFLKEKIGVGKIIGVMLILSGVICITL